MMKSKLILIPICAFYINLCTFGFMRSGGVLYMAFINQFNCTYAQASWPTVLIGSFASFNIATAAFLAHYFEKRSIILTGILLASIAIGLSAFVQTIQWIIFLSAIQGRFFSDFMINYYFSKLRLYFCKIIRYRRWTICWLATGDHIGIF